MKYLAILLFIPLVIRAETHAVLNAERTLIVGYEEHDAGLISTYRADPNKANKVAHLRLLVIPAKPQATLQQTVDPAGTNINDGGYTLADDTVTQVWNLRSLTAQEIEATNAITGELTSHELTTRVRTGSGGPHWEDGFFRVDKLQSELLYYLITTIVRANLHTNLTVPERTRANSVSNEVRQIYDMWQQGRSNHMFVVTNSLVVEMPTNWPAITIDE